MTHTATELAHDSEYSPKAHVKTSMVKNTTIKTATHGYV